MSTDSNTQGSAPAATGAAVEASKPTLPKLEGYLNKLKHKPSFFSDWSSRYFKINAATEKFEYYNNGEESLLPDTKPSRSFSMVDGSVETWPLSDTMFQIEFCDGIRFVIIMDASSIEERDRWLYPLQKYLKDLKQYKVWLTSKMPEPICATLEGYFSKLKRTPNAFGSWNNRYFILNRGGNNQLEYHSTRPVASDGTPVPNTLKKTFEIADIKHVHAIDQWTFQIHITRMLSASFKNFEEVIFTLRAEDCDQQSVWLDALTKYLRQRVEYKEMCEKFPDRVILPAAGGPDKPLGKPVLAVAELVEEDHVTVPVAQRVENLEKKVSDKL